MGFAELDLFLQIVALVGMGFSLADSDFDFDPAIFPIDPQQREGASFDGGLGGKFEDFPFVEQQPPWALCLVVKPLAGGLPWLDITAVEKNLMSLHACEGVRNIDFPGANRFDLGALELQPGFVFIEDVEIPTGLAVGGDFGTHLVEESARKGRFRLDRHRLVHELDLTFDDFGKGNIGRAHARDGRDQR